MPDQSQPRGIGRRIFTWTLTGIALLVGFNFVQSAFAPAPERAVAIPPAASAIAVKLPAQPAWLRYAVVAPVTRGKARIAIVIDGLGMDRIRTQRAVNLPPEVTLSFLAHAANLPEQTAAARRKGHELLLHVPMEPVSAAAALGSYPLGRNLPPEELQRRLRWDLERFDSYVGVDNHMGSAFAADRPAMGVVLRELKSRGLLFFDARALPTQPVAALAGDIGVPYVARDIFLDGEQVAGPVALRLDELEDLARRRGAAIAVAHPHDATLDALARWLPTLSRKGIVVVPLTDIVKTRTGAG